MLSIATSSIITTVLRRPITVSASFSLRLDRYGTHRQYHRLLQHQSITNTGTTSLTHLYATKHKQKSSQPLSTESPQSNNPKYKRVKKEKLLFTETASGYKAPVINWYPGHIAKAERLLTETLKSADVLLEVRDGRIPQSTSHPKVIEWTARRPRIVVLTHSDMIPPASVRAWKKWWDNHEQQKQSGSEGESKNEVYIWVDAKRGSGIPGLHRAITNAGGAVNERRRRRGLRDRALRVAVLGYPNVGKSALINRILGRKRAKSADTPGITRALQWVKVGSGGNHFMTDESGKVKSRGTRRGGGGNYELLDSPGIIAANIKNQEDALLLACCNCIGNPSYDNQGVAAYLCERLKTLHLMGKGDLTSPQWRQKSIERYKFDPLNAIPVASISAHRDAASEETEIRSGEDVLFQVAYNTCRGDLESASRKILQDFRRGRLGPMALQVAPDVDDGNSFDELDDRQMKVEVKRTVSVLGEVETNIEDEQGKKDERARIAVEKAKEKGLELPPIIADALESSVSDVNKNESDVGKGLFDGW